MEIDNFELSQELKQMREQFRILSEKVEKQNIINERHLRDSIRRKMRSYDMKETWVQAIILLISVPLLIIFTIQSKMNGWLTIMTATIFPAATLYILGKKLYQGRKLNFSGDLKTLAQEVKKIKRGQIISNIICTPIAVLYIISFFHEYMRVYHSFVENIDKVYIVLYLIFCALFIAAAIYVEARKFRNLNDIIREIEE